MLDVARGESDLKSVAARGRVEVSGRSVAAEESDKVDFKSVDEAKSQSGQRGASWAAKEKMSRAYN